MGSVSLSVFLSLIACVEKDAADSVTQGDDSAVKEDTALSAIEDDTALTSDSDDTGIEVPLTLERSRILGVSESTFTGWSVASAGDVDGDGTIDLLIGARYDDGYGVSAGSAYLLHGAALPPPGSDLPLSGNAIVWAPNDTQGELGADVAGLGDLNADGYDDVAISAPLTTAQAEMDGAVYVVLGGPTLAGGVLADGETVATYHGEDSYLGAGESISGVADIFGDGSPEILVGDPYLNGGVAYLISGGDVSGDLGERVSLAEAAFKVRGGTNSFLGASVSGVGDVDGDGLGDFVVGAPGRYTSAKEEPGQACLVLGATASEVGGLSSADLDAFVAGVNPEDSTGHVVMAAGDLDGDGYDDYVVMVANSDIYTTEIGVFGHTSGTLVPADAKLRVLGEADHIAITALERAGDINGDGSEQLIAVADVKAAVSRDRLYLLPPGASGTIMLSSVSELPIEEPPELISSLAAGGDLDGDGRGVIVLGVPLDEQDGSVNGAAWLLYWVP